jgi:PilZ domain-containing protein
MFLEGLSLNATYRGQERRAHPRRIIDEHGELTILSENMTLPCAVVNISAGGAKIMCDAIPPSGSEVVLVLSSGKRYKGLTTRYGEGELGVRFTKPAADE